MKLRPIVIIIAAVLVSSFLLYLPFITNTIQFLGFNIKDASMKYIYQNYDGLLYTVPAMSWYNPKAIENIRLEFHLPLEYYAAHLPLYPLFITLFTPLFGYIKSMIFVSLLFSVLLAAFFYKFLKHFNITANPLVLTLTFLFLPRFFIIRSVGAPESLFLFLILLSIFFFEKKDYLLAGIFGGLSAMTKTPGILLLVAYAFVFLEEWTKNRKFHAEWLYVLFLIPLGLILVFELYAVQYGNFFAYFNTGGVVPMPYPFSAFNFQARWVDTAWLEDILLYFFLYLLAISQLIHTKYRSFLYFSLVFFMGAIMVQHRDLSRYMLPLWPFASIAFEKVFTSKKFMIILIILLPAIYLYAVNFILYNTIPVSDWRPFL